MQMAQLFGVTHSTISRWEKGAMALSGPAKKILEKYMENKNRLLMNPHTGSVDTEENWRADFESMTPEERGADTFEGCGLIEVEPDGDGWWREVV